MSRLVGLAFAVALLLSSANPVREAFSRYKVIEAYEIRPGILVMPRYSADGQLCEVGLQRRLYSPGKVRLDASLSRKEIDQVFEELVPDDERGPRSKDFGGALITRAGHGITTTIDFQNVLIQFFSEELSASKESEVTGGDVVATIHWKNRQCQ